jgi:hypothetical protein
LDDDLLVNMHIEQVINMPTNGLAVIFMKVPEEVGLGRILPLRDGGRRLKRSRLKAADGI